MRDRHSKHRRQPERGSGGNSRRTRLPRGDIHGSAEGHPFDRKTTLPGDILRDTEFWAVVDEGPGLSGTSFLSVAEHFPRERVVLFPSWEGDAGRFVNERARSEWALYRKYCTDFEPTWISGENYSGGLWRDALGIHPAAQPQHEARKYRAGEALYKFEGLGWYGEQRFERAVRLGEAGLSPRAKSLDRGFIAYEFVEQAAGAGPPGTDSHCGPLRPSVEDLAKYLAFRRQAFRAERSLSFDQIAEMTAVNIGREPTTPAARNSKIAPPSPWMPG